jgi:hypothetical protein
VQGEVSPSQHRVYNRRSGVVNYDSFQVLRESLTNSRSQLTAITAMTPTQRQFVGTLVDTEAASGYFLKRVEGVRPVWIAYVAAKMKYRGDLARFAELVSHRPPSRSLNKNTITKTLDLRWSVQIQGVVAYTLLREVRPCFFNEKAAIETDCILGHGPVVPSTLPHPFEQCGASRVRRGVWFWPQIDGRDNSENRP